MLSWCFQMCPLYIANVCGYNTDQWCKFMAYSWVGPYVPQFWYRGPKFKKIANTSEFAIEFSAIGGPVDEITPSVVWGHQLGSQALHRAPPRLRPHKVFSVFCARHRVRLSYKSVSWLIQPLCITGVCECANLLWYVCRKAAHMSLSTLAVDSSRMFGRVTWVAVLGTCWVVKPWIGLCWERCGTHEGVDVTLRVSKMSRWVSAWHLSASLPVTQEMNMDENVSILSLQIYIWYVAAFLVTTGSGSTTIILLVRSASVTVLHIS